MNSTRCNRRAFLLRCWRAPDEGSRPSPQWRFSLEEAGTGQKRGFPSLDEMVAFLVAEFVERKETRQPAVDTGRPPRVRQLEDSSVPNLHPAPDLADSGEMPMRSRDAGKATKQ